MGTLLQRKVTNAKLDQSLQDAIYENSYGALKGLINGARELGLERQKVISSAYRMFLGIVKEDYHAESYQYLDNSFPMIKRLLTERIFDREQREGLRGAIKSTLNRNLEKAREVSRPEAKGEMGIKLGISLGISDFTERLAKARAAGMLDEKDGAKYLEMSRRICLQWIERGKIPEFIEFSKKLAEHSLVSPHKLKEKFGERLQTRLQNEGTERFYLEGDKKNRAVAVELNTWHVENDLHELVKMGMIDEEKAAEIVRYYVSKGLISFVD